MPLIDQSKTDIVFDFSTGRTDGQEIYECLKVLFTTPAGTVPFDRDFGIDFRALDQPLPAARGMYAAELAEKARRYEPRVSVKGVSFETEPLSGVLYPVVVIGYAGY